MLSRMVSRTTILFTFYIAPLSHSPKMVVMARFHLFLGIVYLLTCGCSLMYPHSFRSFAWFLHPAINHCAHTTPVPAP